MTKSRLFRTLLACLSSLGLITCGDAPVEPETERTYVTPTGMVTSTTPGVLVGAGDIAECGTNNNDAATAALLDDIEGTVITLGDNAYPSGAASSFSNCYDPTWGRHKARTKPSAGNKEYDATNAAPYFSYFGAAAGQPGQGYYSYDVGAWHIIVLNSNIPRSPGSPQIDWLQADLAAHPNQCTLAYFHHPLYSSTGGTGSGGVTYSSSRTFWDVLYAAGVDVILSGHRHFYERLAPMKPDGGADPTHGIRQFIVGTGGESGGSLTNRFPGHEVGDGRTFGVIKLELFPDSYAWEFIPVAGETFTDSGSGACHGAPGTPPTGPSSTLSSVAVNPTEVAAGETVTVTVTARNAAGQPLSGASVQIAATGQGNTVTQPSTTTNANGIATGAIRSTVAGTKTVSATIGGVSINQTATLSVVAGPPSAAESDLSANPSVISAGSGSSTVTATIRDAFGNAVAGSSVALQALGAGTSLSPTSGTSNGNGVVTAALSATQAGEKLISATADGIALDQQATVMVLEPGGATIQHSLLTSGNNSVNQSVYTTASITPAPNTLITLAVLGHRAASGAPRVPAVSGGGLSWTEVATVTFDTVQTLAHKRLTVFRAMSSSPGSGPITITFNVNLSSAQWVVSQWSGVDASGLNGQAAIVQAVTTRADAVGGLTAGLAPFSSPNNVSFGIVGVNARTPVVVPGAGFTEIAEHASGESVRAALEAQLKPGDNTIAPTWAETLNAGLIGLEIRAAGAP